MFQYPFDSYSCVFENLQKRLFARLSGLSIDSCSLILTHNGASTVTLKEFLGEVGGSDVAGETANARSLPDNDVYALLPLENKVWVGTAKGLAALDVAADTFIHYSFDFSKNKVSPDRLYIEMPMLNGFDVLEELGKNLPFDVVFTTAYDQFGTQAVKFSALDYLLKPVQVKELKEAVEKHLRSGRPPVRSEQVELLLENVRMEKRGRPGKIALATKESIEFVEPGDIICCASDSNYTMVYLTGGRKRLISRTLKEFEDLLVPYRFFRPHNSHLINLDRVRELVRSDGGYLVMENEMKIPVSKNRKEGLMEMLM